MKCFVVTSLYKTTKSTKPTKSYKTKRLIPFWSFGTFEFISKPTGTFARRISRTRDNPSNSIFVIFVVLQNVRTRCADCFNHSFVLVWENCAQIELESVARNVADERRIPCAQRCS